MRRKERRISRPVPITDGICDTKRGKTVANRASADNGGTGSISARASLNQTLKWRCSRSHPNLTASHTKAASPRKLLGYAQTETHDRTSVVQTWVHGSADLQGKSQRPARLSLACDTSGRSPARYSQQTAWKDGSLEKEMSIGVLSLRFVTEAV